MRYELPKGYLSPSSIHLLQLCPKKYEFRYIRGITKPPAVAMSIGTMAHSAFQEYYSTVINDNFRFTPEQMAEYTNDVVIPGYLEENEHVITEEESRSTVPGIASQYVGRLGYSIDPVSTEEAISLTFRCGVEVIGYTDLQYKLGENSIGIADYKITGKTAWTLPRLKNDLQFNMYSYMTGIQDVTIHNYVRDRAIAPKRAPAPEKEGVTRYSNNLYAINNKFDGNQGEYLEDLVERAAALITAGVFMPCDPGSWICTPAMCDYWYMCRGK